MRNANVIVSSTFGPMIVNVNDSAIGASIIRSGFWSMPDINLLSSLLKQRGAPKEKLTFYDVGANIGTHTIALGSIFRSRIKIRSFEAQRNVFHMLCGNVALNNLEDVHCHHAAVSDCDGQELVFRVPDYGKRNNVGGLELQPPVHSDNQDMNFGATERVKTVALDSFDESIDLIKMDIEGMEDKALKGAAKSIASHRPLVFAEIGKTDKAFILSLFQSQDYVGYEKGGDAVFLPKESNITLSDAQKVI